MSPESHGLPGVLGEIAEVAGLEAALAVAVAVGGTRAYIPRRPGADHWLVKAAGEAAAARIVDYFATGRTGVEIEFPAGPGGSYNRERRQRARKVADLEAQGLSNGQIARQAGITRRAVYMAKAKRREKRNGPQGDLGF